MCQARVFSVSGGHERDSSTKKVRDVSPISLSSPPLPRNARDAEKLIYRRMRFDPAHRSRLPGSSSSNSSSGIGQWRASPRRSRKRPRFTKRDRKSWRSAGPACHGASPATFWSPCWVSIVCLVTFGVDLERVNAKAIRRRKFSRGCYLDWTVEIMIKYDASIWMREQWVAEN